MAQSLKNMIMHNPEQSVKTIEQQLLFDDDLEISLLFQEALKYISRVKIFTFTDPVLALEHFRINEYAYVLVISDFKMPGLNGMEF